MTKKFVFIPLLFSLVISCAYKPKKTTSTPKNTPKTQTLSQQSQQYSKPKSLPLLSSLISETHQITFKGRRAGEGYFDPQGKWMVFQSERQKGNPFYQIYLMNLKTGKTRLISTGKGKTTCSWIHPSGRKVLFSSTHLDPQFRQKAKKEFLERKKKAHRKYAWNYDPYYDIFVRDLKTNKLTRLTKAKGYDAEGSFSPDGKWIVFASNRHAYSSKLSKKEQALLKKDPSYFMDIYIMKADGSQIKRLTHTPGYDGGPFFSPDGQSIVWRRFSTKGPLAEIYTMKIDGSQKKQITHLNVLSWAPFYHPSGDYIIFSANKTNPHQFDLFIVRTDGKGEPIQITNTPEADVLPVFTPDGHSLAWTLKNRNGQAQIYKAKWDDRKARKLLGLKPWVRKKILLSPYITENDVESLINFFSSKEFLGRKAGSFEEKIYTQKIADIFRFFGLHPAGDNKSYFQNFTFKSATELGKNNALWFNNKLLTLKKLWAPLPFSKSGDFKARKVLFMGYGIHSSIPQLANYNSYTSSVKGKWVLLLNDLPQDINAKDRLALYPSSSLHQKIITAQQKGARGVIFIQGPQTAARSELVMVSPSHHFPSLSIPVLTIHRKLIEKVFKKKGLSLSALQKKLDKGSPIQTVQLSLPLKGHIEILQRISKARNTLALLKVPGAKRTLIIGAHGDHLGKGHPPSSRATSEDKDLIHYGADDNASGMAGVLELAHYFSSAYSQKLFHPKQNILFAIWSGEELGNLGSSHFVKKYKNKYHISAYLNMDMIGRFQGKLLVQGVGSSPQWPLLLEQMAAQNPLPIKALYSPYLPTDSTSFYLAQTPILNFFTGSHEDYHTPRDTADKITIPETTKVIQYIQQITEMIATKNFSLPYHKVSDIAPSPRNKGFRTYLGTIPDYTQDNIQGVALSGVINNGPAQKAGLKKGDIIVELGNTPIRSIYDYVASLKALVPGKKTEIVVLRNHKKLKLSITPLLR